MEISAERLAQVAESVGGELAKEKKAYVLKTGREKAKEACLAVAGMEEMYHLSTITALDAGEEITIFYHFWQGRDFVTVKTAVPKHDGRTRSLMPELPAAELYEAEVSDLFGVVFDGNPLMGRRLLLPDEYPRDAPPPLTKEADPEKIRKMMGLE